MALWKMGSRDLRGLEFLAGMEDLGVFGEKFYPDGDAEMSSLGGFSLGDGADRSWSCNCIGPQNGEPLCPCQMRGVEQRSGRWVVPERDLGPVVRRGSL